MKQSNIRYPKITRLGSLNTLVRESGNNNDDGNRWSKTVNDDHHPRIRFEKRSR